MFGLPISIAECFIILIAFALILHLTGFLLLHKNKKQAEKAAALEQSETPSNKQNKNAKIAIILGIGTGFLLTAIFCLTVIITMRSHGATSDDVWTMTWVEAKERINLSPKEDSIDIDNDKTDLAGAIIIYYRFGCPDCEAVYEELSAVLKDRDNVYWMTDESEKGKALIKKYPVEEVPTGIYIRVDGYKGNVPYTQKPLYIEKADENGSHLDTVAINRLLELQDTGR